MSNSSSKELDNAMAYFIAWDMKSINSIST